MYQQHRADARGIDSVDKASARSQRGRRDQPLSAQSRFVAVNMSENCASVAAATIIEAIPPAEQINSL
jgi:hypothetical protein